MRIAMMMIGATVAMVSGCAAYTSHATPSTAAHYAPTDRVEVAPAPPAGAELVGHVSAQGNNLASADGCRARLERDARELGATAIVVREATAGSAIGQGPHCEADAYR